jgi:hypothetical protein
MRLHKSKGKTMAELPHPWGVYLRLQSELDDSAEINDRNFGLEAALNSLVAQTPTIVSDGEVDRTIASAARNNRHRVMLRRKYFPRTEPTFDPRPFLDARARLRLVHAAVTDGEWDLLRAVGAGYDYDEIKGTLSAGAVRVKVLRLRARLARAA